MSGEGINGKLECSGVSRLQKAYRTALGDCRDNDASHRLGWGGWLERSPMSGGRENDDSHFQ